MAVARNDLGRAARKRGIEGQVTTIRHFGIRCMTTTLSTFQSDSNFKLKFAKPLSQASNQQNKHKTTTFDIFFFIFQCVVFISVLVWLKSPKYRIIQRAHKDGKISNTPVAKHQRFLKTFIRYATV